jgi:FkbH-like protein
VTPSDIIFTVTANFTADPIGKALQFWLERLGWTNARVEFSGYNQIFQDLISPISAPASDRRGVNLFLIRLEDWARHNPDADLLDAVTRVSREFIGSFQSFLGRASRPGILLLCPPSERILADPQLANKIRLLEAEIRAALKHPGVSILTGEDFAALYPVDCVSDPESDRQGHIPFTPAYWTVLATVLARKARALLSPPHKVIAVDADNTLWNGVAAEWGASRVQVDGVWREAQEFLLDRKRQGMLLALVSKNKDEDVARVFERPDMMLRREDFASWRVNWKPKSDNLRDVASELELGLDSFIFLDDNPMECAEVSAHCPAVTVLQLPEAEQISWFLRHVWVFDLPPATAADRNRTEQYRQQAERIELLAAATSFADFMRKLDLRVELRAPVAEQIGRAAQLTQRTNQFNTTGVRRTESELHTLLLSGKREALLAQVRDRFGDYGEVGLCVYSARGNDLEVENFLLSCRVLGKGVEHQLLAALGRIATERGKAHVVIPFHPTERNEPAAGFLESAGSAFRDGTLYRFPADAAKAVAFQPQDTAPPSPAAIQVRVKEAIQAGPDYGEFALHLTTPSEIEVAMRRKYLRTRPTLAVGLATPRNPTEQRLAEIWSDVLGLDCVGVHDNFFDLGGDSIHTIQILARANQAGLRLSIRQHNECPTIAGQAVLAGRPDTARSEGIGATTPSKTSRPFSLARLGNKSLDQVLAHLAKAQQ